MSTKSIVSLLIIPSQGEHPAIECHHLQWYGLAQLYFLSIIRREMSAFFVLSLYTTCTVPAGEGQGGECCLYMSFWLGFVQGYIKVLGLNLYTFKEPRNRFRQAIEADGIDSLGTDSWAPQTFTNTGSIFNYNEV